MHEDQDVMSMDQGANCPSRTLLLSFNYGFILWQRLRNFQTLDGIQHLQCLLLHSLICRHPVVPSLV